METAAAEAAAETLRAKLGMRGGRAIRFSACGLRAGTRFKQHTAGGLYVVYAMCPCGFLMPPMELPDSESTRFVVAYIIKLFEGYKYVKPGRTDRGFCVVFDDMCHAVRWGIDRVRDQGVGL